MEYLVHYSYIHNRINRIKNFFCSEIILNIFNWNPHYSLPKCQYLLTNHLLKMLFFLEVNLETLVCLIIIEKQCSLVFKIMDSGASLPGSNSQILP